MLQLPRREPLTEYVLQDADGRDIGVVMAPAGGPQMGRGAETVLLLRRPAGRCREAVPTAA